MATSKSAEKRVRQNRKKQQHNNSWKTRFRTARAELEKAIENGEDDGTVEKLGQQAISLADKIASRDIIHDNKAARWKSRVQKQVDGYK